MTLTNCPECNRAISPRAAACPGCGFPIASEIHRLTDAAMPVSPNPIPQTERRALPADQTIGELHEIAYRQKLLLYAILVNLVSVIPTFVLITHPVFRPLGWALWLGNIALELWCWYKVGLALKKPLPYIWFLSIGLFLPCISLLVLVVMNASATSALQKADIRVGLMGADLSAVQQAR